MAVAFSNISEMIDLSIGSPETGVVDFNMLQAVMHCLAQQLGVLAKPVELRGSTANIPMAMKDSARTINIKEYTYDTDTTPGEITKKDEIDIRRGSPGRQAADDTILVVERVRKVEAGTKTVVSAPSSADGRATTSGGGQLGQTPSTEKLSLVTVSQFNLLESKVNDLTSRVYGSMEPKSVTLGDEDYDSLKKKLSELTAMFNAAMNELRGGTAGLLDGGKQGGSRAGPSGPSQDTDGYRTSLAYTTSQAHRTSVSYPGSGEYPHAAGGGGGAAGLSNASEMIMTPAGPKQLTLANLNVTLTSRMNELEHMMKDCCQDVHKYECIITEKIQSLDDQMVHVLKEVHDRPGTEPSDTEIKDNLEKISEVFDTVNNLQSQLHDLSASAQQLASEKTQREQNINTLLEQIELLKVIKMDREDVLEAMADKVDMQMLTRKVSRDQFEVACDDLAKGMQNTIEKLNMQESLWQQALDDIQREIETKLDKLELCPVKEFFNSKLRQLQENLKKIAALRREVEAAGTKRKILRDVKCLSCDTEAVMPMESHPPPASRPLQPTVSMKPYLTYELDAIRKQQACPVQQRNMHDWEHIGKQMAQVKPVRARSAVTDKDKHLCNRYCGGSHTVTTAAQRVARLGHFIKQWGPDVLPLTSGLAAGDDGKFYRVTTTENVKGPEEVPCTPRQSKKQERTSLPGDDCRCLEEKSEKTEKTEK